MTEGRMDLILDLMKRGNMLFKKLSCFFIVLMFCIPAAGEYNWQCGYDNGISIRHKTTIGWFGLSLNSNYYGYQIKDTVNNAWNNEFSSLTINPSITYLKYIRIIDNLDVGPYMGLGYWWNYEKDNNFNISNKKVFIKVAAHLSYTFKRVVFETKMGLAGDLDFRNRVIINQASFFGGGLSSIGIMLLF